MNKRNAGVYREVEVEAPTNEAKTFMLIMAGEQEGEGRS